MINKDMNYKRLYQKIIQNRQGNPVDGYTERHHIVPRSLGGTDDPDNLVDLTAREHFICHYLLAKMYPADSNEWHKMNHAFMMMRNASGNQDRYFNSRLYESARQNFRAVMSRAQSGTQNSQHGKMWINRVGTLENRKIPRTEPIPDGWQKGRKIISQSLQDKHNSCKVCGEPSKFPKGNYCELHKPKPKNFISSKLCKSADCDNEISSKHGVYCELCRRQRMMKTVAVDDGYTIFESIKDCAESYGRSPSWVCKQIKKSRFYRVTT